MNFVEEIKKFDLIKNTKVYELAKLEVLLKLDKVYIWTKDGHIAVLSSNAGEKSIYIYTDRELITSDYSNYEEFSLSKFIIVLKNRDNNFNSCFINKDTESSSILSENIQYLINRYEEIYTNTSFRNTNSLELKERTYIVAREATDENNIDVLIRNSGNDKYIYIYTEADLAKNKVHMEQLSASKLVGLNNEKLGKLITNLNSNGINKVIVNFGTNNGMVVGIEEIISLLA
ncbi:hypothetical protein [Clostridium intestinale]|uniref:Uncharacterized protein n=1 Tax=Clostridium intestinale URNW TaxID=1294142 RepID=U2Q0Q8_9CLOT|nr:hypothetical protein [Clostridium intestinale]ERK29599.1 hypothetical protein CINTURNW_3103 [Clostridium intestinale URNW]